MPQTIKEASPMTESQPADGASDGPGTPGERNYRA